MFYEVKGVKQEPGNLRRRWFQAEDMDLIVWFEGIELVRFQLSYNRHLGERSIIWSRESGYHHHRIDDGEQQPGHYKSAPIITGYLPLDFSAAKEAYLKHIDGDDRPLFQEVLDHLDRGHRQQ
ncbi:MAG: hypothetical protein KDK23_05930 [Leptospiraceae bacterium]|nr:hypothetical protein [Leptospiraceae bacterium]